MSLQMNVYQRTLRGYNDKIRANGSALISSKSLFGRTSMYDDGL